MFCVPKLSLKPTNYECRVTIIGRLYECVCLSVCALSCFNSAFKAGVLHNPKTN